MPFWRHNSSRLRTPDLEFQWLIYTKIILHSVQFTLIQSLSCVKHFVTPWTAAPQAFLSITNFWSLPRLKSFELVMPSNNLILCHTLLLLSSIFPSIKVFSSESTLCIRWPKDWSFSPSNEYSGLISQELSLQHIQIIRTAQLKKKKTHQKN